MVDLRKLARPTDRFIHDSLSRWAMGLHPHLFPATPLLLAAHLRWVGAQPVGNCIQVLLFNAAVRLAKEKLHRRREFYNQSPINQLLFLRVLEAEVGHHRRSGLGHASP